MKFERMILKSSVSDSIMCVWKWTTSTIAMNCWRILWSKHLPNRTSCQFYSICCTFGTIIYFGRPIFNWSKSAYRKSSCIRLAAIQTSRAGILKLIQPFCLMNWSKDRRQMKTSKSKNTIESWKHWKHRVKKPKLEPFIWKKESKSLKQPVLCLRKYQNYQLLIFHRHHRWCLAWESLGHHLHLEEE